jgi:hypothetical protein
MYVRLDNDSYFAGRGGTNCETCVISRISVAKTLLGDISGEVVINLAADDRLLSPVNIRFVGYEESFDNHHVFLEEVQDLEVGGFTRRNSWDRNCFPLCEYNKFVDVSFTKQTNLYCSC